MKKAEQVKAFENDLIALCQRYLIEFDIDAAIMMYVFLGVVKGVFAEIIKEDLDDNQH